MVLYEFDCPHCERAIHFEEPDRDRGTFSYATCECQRRFALEQVWCTSLTKFVPYTSSASDSASRRDDLHWYQFSFKTVAEWHSELRIALREPVVEMPHLYELTLLVYRLESGQPRKAIAFQTQSKIWNHLQYSQTRNYELTPSALETSEGRRITAGVSTIIVGAVLGVIPALSGSMLYWLSVMATSGCMACLDWGGARDGSAPWNVEASAPSLPVENNQTLLERKLQCERKQARFEQLREEQQGEIDRLEDLSQRMQALDPALYANRLEVFDRAIALRQQSLEQAQQLRDGYEYLAAMVEIEYETAQLAEALPDSGSPQLLQRFEALEKLEEERVSLELAIDPERVFEQDLEIG